MQTIATLFEASVAWVASHKTEIATFVAAGALAVAPEQYRPFVEALATLLGVTTMSKWTAQGVAKKAVDEHVEEHH